MNPSHRIVGVHAASQQDRDTVTTMKTIVISPVGEPGSGKSVFSFWLVHELKMRGIHTEFVPEIIKYESYTQDGMARARSGRFDFRYLGLQHAATRPLIGHTEVVVNDGCLPAFLYYAERRMPPDRAARLRKTIDRYLAEQQPADHRYVTLVRGHDYTAVGRRQDEAEAARLRPAILGSLKDSFGIAPEVVPSDVTRRTEWLDRLVSEVLANRAQPVPSRARPR